MKVELKHYLNNLFKRVILALFLLIIISYALKNNIYYEEIYNIMYADTIDFSYLNSKYRYLLGTLKNEDGYVIADKLKYKSIKKYHNSYYLETDHNLVINNINPGVVTFIGDIDKLGKTIIVSGDNNIDYWYSNIENIAVKLYDHIEKEIIGNVKGNKLIMTFKKDDEYLSYEDYL